MKKLFVISFSVICFSWLLPTGLYGAAEPKLTEKEEQFFKDATRANLQGVNSYLAEGGSVNVEGLGKQTALHAAAWAWRTPVIERLFQEEDIDINKQDVSGETPLHLATQRGAKDIAALLIARPDILLDVKNKKARTPLLEAARAGKFDLAVQLFRAGADAEAVNAVGQNLLHIALDQGQVDFVKDFFQRSAVAVEIKQALKKAKDNDKKYPIDYLDLNDPEEATLQDLLSVTSLLVGQLEELSSHIQELGQR